MGRHDVIRLRARLGLTQEQLAGLLACTQVSVHRMEGGHRPVPGGLRLIVLTCLQSAAERDLAAVRAVVTDPSLPVAVRLARVFLLAHP